MSQKNAILQFTLKISTIQAKTAILLFTRTPFDEVRYKSFFKGRKDKNLLLVNRLIAHVQKEVRKTNLPLFISYSSNQVGHTFGERLSTSIEQVFSQGFEKVVIIGNDCPSLDATILLQAASKVETDQIVLGPNHDGGVYLVAINKHQFDKKDFSALDWETPHLYDSFRKYIEERKIQQYDLIALHDANQLQDLENVIYDLPYQHVFTGFLLYILSTQKTKIFTFIDILVLKIEAILVPQRGPPTSSFLLTIN